MRVSEEGEVFNGMTGQRLRESWAGRYARVQFPGEGRDFSPVLVHRIVASAFHREQWAADKEVNHKDGDKGNNHPSNLEWVTRHENMQHAYRMGLVTIYDRHGIANPNAKLTPEAMLEICASSDPARLLSVRYGVSMTTIHATRAAGAVSRGKKKLTPTQVAAIKADVGDARSVAAKYAVALGTVYRIRSRP